MRLLTVKMAWMYGDSEETKAEREKRIEFLASIGIRTFGADHQPIICVNETQYIDIIAAKWGIEEILAINEDGRSHGSAVDKIKYLIDKFESCAVNAKDSQFNEKVEVYTPGMGLMSFNCVTLLEDCCSDYLQGHLDSGWSIIAACPQPNQRRPDYIMGRYDPEKAKEPRGDSRALRGQSV